MLTYETLNQGHELEQFFAGIPGFCSSTKVKNPQSSLARLGLWNLTSALDGFLEPTWSSNLVSEGSKMRRFRICVRAIVASRLIPAHHVLWQFFEQRSELPESFELGHSLTNWDNHGDLKTTLFGVLLPISSQAHCNVIASSYSS